MIARLLSILLLTLLSIEQAHAELVVTTRNIFDSRYLNYYTDLVTLALEKTRPEYGDYRMKEISTIETKRTLAMVVQNTHPNLIIELAYDEQLTADHNLMFIDIPVDGGTIGYRACYVNPAIKEELKKVNTFEGLRKYTFGQGVGWADTAILRHNGLKVIEIANFESIFKMTIAGRLDFFCRGASQIKDEVEQFKLLNNIAIDDTFILSYSLPRFFYLNSKNTLAKKRIAAGMKIAFADGSLKRLWLKYNKEGIDFIKMKGRRVYKLENPFIKNLNPDYSHYFFDPLAI